MALNGQLVFGTHDGLNSKPGQSPSYSTLCKFKYASNQNYVIGNMVAVVRVACTM